MTVRAKIALTVFVTGLLTAFGVIATLVYAFQRFEHETTYRRASDFLARVVASYDDMLVMHERHPDEFTGLLRSLVLFENDTQLYLLDARGTVLASTGRTTLPSGFKVALEPVREAAGPHAMPYVMGDDPEHMQADAVIAAVSLRRPVIRPDEPVAGYLYLVAHRQLLPEDRLEVVRSTFTRPALVLALSICAISTLLAAWIIGSVTRPLRELTQAVAKVSREGLGEAAPDPGDMPLPAGGRGADEFAQLAGGFRAMLAVLRAQWEALRRLDHFRREGVSNLSHDLRSPLTATTTCLETLERRWSGDAGRADDRALVEVALRNTRNAARLVQSLGDLAQLDEPAFRLATEVLDVGELVDDIARRFAQRALDAGVSLQAEAPADAPNGASAAQASGGGSDVASGDTPADRAVSADSDTPMPFAALDIELFERAVANLVDNALKFCRPGDRITLAARVVGARVEVSVADTGPGIAAADLPHLFDRFYQSRHSVAPATGEGGKGLGLAIVKRIAELHGGEVRVASEPGHGTSVTISLPMASM